MLIDIYARSMVTAARQDCVRLRDLPPAKPLPRAYQAPPRKPGLLARLTAWLRGRPPQACCINPQEI
ncbi:hypothetical protein [Leisingera sp. McT4-56]|uniref:hypothetical protein n=1 Tax=Leisingera sp. McT4-56 TaxID=2881255 RepID=UPI001CF86894|nr:hypothetical protein [Leisingera sp. McT4-56]MCB4456631.1 hypothetical protein [Leisingera sp. McT4-56]